MEAKRERRKRKNHCVRLSWLLQRGLANSSCVVVPSKSQSHLSGGFAQAALTSLLLLPSERPHEEAAESEREREREKKGDGGRD